MMENLIKLIDDEFLITQKYIRKEVSEAETIADLRELIADAVSIICELLPKNEDNEVSSTSSGRIYYDM